ncbi:MAG TPA: hypothetical protein VHJ82_08115 [Actinomycetota bacterium]|nr:hypothetical protein [Actinomycetota bacterium]
MTTVTEDQLQEIAAAFAVADVPGPQEQDPVRWAPRAWESKLGDLDGVPPHFIETKSIARAALLERGQRLSDSPEDRRAFFISIMAWGYGRAWGGPWRVRQMLSDPDADDKIRRVIELVRTEGAVAGYRALAHGGEAHLKYLGPSFATKLLYFAGYGTDVDPRPLILDRRVGAALDTFGIYLRYGAFDSSHYEAYLALAAEVAAGAARNPHDVEWWLFTRGGNREASPQEESRA